MLDYNNYFIGNLEDIFIASYVIIDDIDKKSIPIDNSSKYSKSISNSIWILLQF